MSSSVPFAKCSSCEFGFIGKDNDYKGFFNEPTNEKLCLNCYEGRVMEQAESAPTDPDKTKADLLRQAAELKAKAREANLDKEITFRHRVSFDKVYKISVRDLMEFITDHRENVMAHMTEQYLVHYAQTATKHYRLPDEVYDDEHLVGSDANDTDIDNILALLDVKNKIKYRPQQPPQ
jgi:hypothetical protein